MHFLEEVKKINNDMVQIDSSNGTWISFISGNRYEFVPAENAVYLINTTGNRKVAERVETLNFSTYKETEKTIIVVEMKIGEQEREVHYVMGQGHKIGNNTNEGNFTNINP
jgi:hypothetical protein